MMSSIRQIICCLLFLMGTCSQAAQTKGPRYTGNSPRSFVEGFYSWYVPRALNDDTIQGWKVTLSESRSILSPELASLLAEDRAAQANCKEIIGLDFDPFLLTQDPAEHYEVGSITQKDEHYRAEIYRIESGKRSEKPDIIAEFVRREKRWFFVNFYSPHGINLLAVLKLPRPKCSAPRSPDKK